MARKTTAKERVLNKRGQSRTQRKLIKIGEKVSVTEENHAKLLSHLVNMLAPHLSVRSSLLSRFDEISRGLAAYMKQEGENTVVEQRHKDGTSSAIPPQKYPIAIGHIEDIVTHVMTILFPARQMYGSTEVDPDQQDLASAFVQVLNRHAQDFGHYTEYTKFIFDAIAYNLGITEVDWEYKYGWLNDRQDGLGSVGMTDIITQGNRITRLDPYNTILDYSAPVEGYAAKAEFYATVEPATAYQIEFGRARREYYGGDELGDKLRDVRYTDGKAELLGSEHPYYTSMQQILGPRFKGDSLGSGLYRHRPPMRGGQPRPGSKNDGTAFHLEDYLAWGGCENNGILKSTHTNEIITVTCRIKPKQFGVKVEGGALNENDYQIWRFKVLNGNWIIFAQQVSGSHGLLPTSITQPHQEFGAYESKAVAENLIPFQELISNIHNLYIRGMRKSVNNGRIFVNSAAGEIHQYASIDGGIIPVTVPENHNGQTMSLDQMIKVVNDKPEINTSIRDIAQIKELMQDVLPTELMEVMADLNRATDHQSRSVSNAASRRLFMLARVISDQSIVVNNYMMTQNVITMQPSISVLNSAGQQVTIDPATFRDASISIAVSDGLRGIDTVSIANRVSQVLQYAMQSRTVQGTIDVIKLLEYLLQMEGATFNIEQFRYKNQFDALEPEQKQLAYQLLQQAAQNQQ